MAFTDAAILLSFMQWIMEYLAAVKYFDYSCTLEYKMANYVKKLRRHVDKMNARCENFMI